jgi:hypothetical protein
MSQPLQVQASGAPDHVLLHFRAGRLGEVSRLRLRRIVAANLVAGERAPGQAAAPTVGAQAEAARWTALKFGGVAESLPGAAPGRPPLTTEPPFSFTYDGKSFRDLAWKPVRASSRLDDCRTEHTLPYADDKTGLQLRCVAVEYHDFPAVEWTAYFKNAGTSSTPILENIQGLDARFERGAHGEFVLHGIKGDFCAADSFEPYQRTLASNSVTKFAPPASGKSCDGPKGWPYFNLRYPDGGVILAVGWPGQWAASFTRDNAAGLRIQAGQELTRLILKPGEEIRTPLIALLFWQGADVVEAQNLWRRWYVAHNMPRVEGKAQQAVAQIQVGAARKTSPMSSGSWMPASMLTFAGAMPAVLGRASGFRPEPGHSRSPA